MIKVVVDKALEESWRELLEEGLSRSEAKIQMAGVRRFTKILETQLRWHGIPYEFKRLPSRICPNCEVKMEELPGRKMRCPRCGLEEDRDRIPILWALRLTESANGRTHLARALNPLGFLSSLYLVVPVHRCTAVHPLSSGGGVLKAHAQFATNERSHV